MGRLFHQLAGAMTGVERDNPCRHPVRGAAGNDALQTRDRMREVPDLRRSTARRSASGMTAARAS
jgi:hypothetical protein